MSFASFFKKLILFGIGIGLGLGLGLGLCLSLGIGNGIIILLNIYLNKISILAQTKLNAKAKVDEVNLKKKLIFFLGIQYHNQNVMLLFHFFSITIVQFI